VKTQGVGNCLYLRDKNVIVQVSVGGRFIYRTLRLEGYKLRKEMLSVTSKEMLC